MRIQFLVPGEPTGKGRPRFTKTGCAYTPPKTVAYEQTVRYSYLNAVAKNDIERKFADGTPIRARIEAVFRIPAHYSKAKYKAAIEGELKPTKKPDADNIAKIILDSLNGIAYHDDSAVVECTVIKRYGECSHVTVVLEEVM